MTIRHVTDAASVMTQLGQGATGLIVIDPPNVPRLDELLDAVRTYYPEAMCRQYARRPKEDATDSGRETSAQRIQPPPLAAAVVSKEELAMLMSPLGLEEE